MTSKSVSQLKMARSEDATLLGQLRQEQQHTLDLINSLVGVVVGFAQETITGELAEIASKVQLVVQREQVPVKKQIEQTLRQIKQFLVVACQFMTRNTPEAEAKPVKDLSQTGNLTIGSDRSNTARILPLRDLEQHLQGTFKESKPAGD